MVSNGIQFKCSSIFFGISFQLPVPTAHQSMLQQQQTLLQPDFSMQSAPGLDQSFQQEQPSAASIMSPAAPMTQQTLQFPQSDPYSQQQYVQQYVQQQQQLHMQQQQAYPPAPTPPPPNQQSIAGK